MFQQIALSLDDAKRVAAAARVEAEKNGWAVVIAVVDDGGHLMYLERLDGCQKASSRIAEKKARTAILFKRPSKAIEDVVMEGRSVMMGLPGAVPLEGRATGEGRRVPRSDRCVGRAVLSGWRDRARGRGRVVGT